MLSKLRGRVQDEKGFTLIELLVVILIIGILAAIAIPSFLNQRAKAYDAAAKSNLVTAQTADETYATDNDGSYATTLAQLQAVEPALKNSPLVTVATSGGSDYTLTATANGPNGGADVFTLTDVSGTVTRQCSGNAGGCPNGSW